MSRKQVGWVLFLIFSLTASLQAQYNLLYSFAGGTTDGLQPYFGSLIMSGSTLYGMTAFGGPSNCGTIFKINKDGTGYALLHSFAGSASSDGAHPFGSLILSGSTLYGMTASGGTNDLGTMFRINTNGMGFVLLHSFAGGGADGQEPYGSLTKSGSTLYGMTYSGGIGTANLGTIFKINTNGSGFVLLHSFAGGTADGGQPMGSLLLRGSILYGMTYLGGTTNFGTIFRINTKGSGFVLLHSFAVGTADGYYPQGSLIIKGSILYGMTVDGGTTGYGTIFKINKNGTGFELLHSFAIGAGDGKNPYGSLISKGSMLYGMTERGGTDDYGTIFKINKNGSGFELLHSFAGATSDGSYPFGSLVLKGFTMYGMTYSGGTLDDGTIFSFKLK